jgi:hypothetical protein
MASQQLTSLSISAASSGANTALAAVTGYKIRVHSYTLVAAGAVTAKFKSATGGNDLTGAMSLITGTPLVVPFQREGHFETTVSELLNLVLGGAVQVSGHLTYSLVQ